MIAVQDMEFLLGHLPDNSATTVVLYASGQGQCLCACPRLTRLALKADWLILRGVSVIEEFGAGAPGAQCGMIPMGH